MPEVLLLESAAKVKRDKKKNAARMQIAAVFNNLKLL